VKNPNHIKFTKTHTFTVKNYTTAYAWIKSTRKQIRVVDGIYAALSSQTTGDLTDERARVIIKRFEDCSFSSFNDYTLNIFSAFILREDDTRPEGCNYTCSINAKTFTCEHSLEVANVRGLLLQPNAAQVKLLRQKRRRGRRAQVAGAWVFQQLDIGSPVAHPQQDAVLLADGNAEMAGINLELENEVV
jgi:hypothetical protein